MLWKFYFADRKEIDLKYHSKMFIVLGKYNKVAFFSSFLEHVFIECSLHEGLLTWILFLLD